VVGKQSVDGAFGALIGKRRRPGGWMRMGRYGMKGE